MLKLHGPEFAPVASVNISTGPLLSFLSATVPNVTCPKSYSRPRATGSYAGTSDPFLGFADSLFCPHVFLPWV